MILKEKYVESQIFKKDQETSINFFSVRNIAIGLTGLVLITGCGLIYAFKEKIWGSKADHDLIPTTADAHAKAKKVRAAKVAAPKVQSAMAQDEDNKQQSESQFYKFDSQGYLDAVKKYEETDLKAEQAAEDAQDEYNKQQSESQFYKFDSQGYLDAATKYEKALFKAEQDAKDEQAAEDAQAKINKI